MMKHRGAEKRLLLWPDQRQIGFTNPFQLRFEVVVIVEPALNLVLDLRPDTELLRHATGVPDRQDPGRMALASSTFQATFLVPDRAMQERAAHDVSDRRKIGSQLFPISNGCLMFHQ
jgi:hypothetical protein